MNQPNAVGVHGKLPQQSDFLTRNLPMSFIAGWDDWMQRSLLSSQQALGNRWLDIYLTSPIWRFVLSSGVLDQQVWAGVMVPSVDKVGRYYPLVLAQPLAAEVVPTALLVEAGDWFSGLEALAIAILQDDLPLAEVGHKLQQLAPWSSPQPPAQGSWQAGRPLAMGLADDGNPVHGYVPLLHAMLLQRFPSYSLWSSSGSERMTPAQLISGYLPAPQCYTSLLTGDWSQHGWSMLADVITPLAFCSNSCNNTHDIQNE